MLHFQVQNLVKNKKIFTFNFSDVALCTSDKTSTNQKKQVFNINCNDIALFKSKNTSENQKKRVFTLNFSDIANSSPNPNPITCKKIR